jgi:DNA polymerase-1
MDVIEKAEHYKRYGWTTDEENLATLPPSAPQAVRDMTKWLTLEGRRSSLEEWLGCVSEDSRIHGKFWGIGAWTHRMAHTNPNQANIFSPFHGEPKNSVEEVKAKYDLKLRSLWHTDKVLVGTDLDAAQLRVLACIMKSSTWREAIMKGDKKAGTDIHTMNMKALGSVCKDRDTSKTFIYAWLLGASIPKLAEIFGCSVKQASEANVKFLSAFPELKKLKDFKIPTDASRGYFVGLDGRKVACNSEHLMLAGYLQNGEAVIAKHWTVQWRRMAKASGLWFRQVDLVHDETQVEVENEEDAKKLVAIQKEAMDIVNKKLNLFCPMDIDARWGKSWAESH